MKSILDFLSYIFDELTDVVQEILKPTTFFAMMFFSTFCFLVLKGIAIPDVLNNIVSMIVGFWFGKQSNETKKVNGNGEVKP